MYCTSACSAALPSAVTTVSVAPATSFGDFAAVSCGTAMAAATPATATTPPAIQGQRLRCLSSKPCSSPPTGGAGRVAVS
jgi:hypothetical protein